VARDILRHSRERLAPWMRVRRLEFEELSKTISGKIRRVELRAREEELAAAGETSPASGPHGEWRDEMFPELGSQGRQLVFGRARASIE
jgi:acetyl-CoA synthetase